MTNEKTNSSNLIFAAGGIVWRKGARSREIAVVHRSRYNDWCLPKGKPDRPEETLEATALREVKEEIGCEAKITTFAGAIDYIAKETPKVVFFWNMEVVSDCVFKPSEEVDQLVWLTPKEAIKRLNYPEERNLIMRIYHKRKLLGAGWHPIVFVSCLGFLSLRYRRLSGSIDAFRSELDELIRRRIPPGRLAPTWAQAARDLLVNAEESLNRWRIDEAWKLFHAAVRMRVYGFDEDEIKNESTAVRQEADKKLDGWRQKAVFKLIGHPECPSAAITADQLYQAMFIRDEHFNNQAYKDNIFRRTTLTLVSILSALLIALILLFFFDHLPLNQAADCPGFEKDLLIGLVLFGLLGSTFSAMTKMSDSGKPSRIPELVGARRITFLRIFMGAASALVIYIFTKSQIATVIKIGGLELDKLEAYTIYAISFSSGFSERLVLKAVEKVSGKD